ncbi:MAG TPA: hypothetical protein PLO24_09255 [Bacteroidales bacterium]|jgi:hypothetical protein|nr:hypothetical protein [Bacteroidales bacterium]HQH24090.1 hypothetical protein [Bacteroidales bacterium]HQJ83044.1 hypothetical protein [Bacteroidales bacterium]
MKKIFPAIYLLILHLSGVTAQTSFPEAEISNGIIRAHLYLPDAENGYYRATRFDWSGIITNLEFSGHSYFGKWFEKYSPTINDAIMGPVEEFGPVGYDDVKAGGNFVMIGVGALEKPDEPGHGRFKLYKIADPGSWKTVKKPRQIRFVHELKGPDYSYEYSKTVRAVKGKPVLVLSHSLKNTGKKTIETTVYNHNFMIIDKAPAGPDYLVHFPVEISGETGGLGTYARFQGNRIVFTENLAKSIMVNPVLGFGNDRKEYNFRIENIKTGAGVKITGDKPVDKLIFWASPKTICPEPYITVKAEPGKTFKWEIFYEFYTFEPEN